MEDKPNPVLRIPPPIKIIANNGYVVVHLTKGGQDDYIRVYAIRPWKERRWTLEDRLVAAGRTLKDRWWNCQRAEQYLNKELKESQG